MINEKKTQKKLRIYPREVFKEISLGDDENNLQLYYAISNFGRLISYKDNISNGRIIEGSLQDGYRMWNYRIFLDNIRNYITFIIDLNRQSENLIEQIALVIQEIDQELKTQYGYKEKIDKALP